MADLHEKAVNQRGALQRLMEVIPGFKGYMDAETRRDVDKVQRDFCADKVFAQKDKVKSVLNDLISGGDIDGITPFEKLLNKLDGVAMKLRNADRGYSGLFDTVKVTQDTLDDLYQYDLGMTEAVNELESKVAALNADDKSALMAQVKETTQLLDRVQDHFAKREGILRGTGA
jgi:hypothetical protein